MIIDLHRHFTNTLKVVKTLTLSEILNTTNFLCFVKYY